MGTRAWLRRLAQLTLGAFAMTIALVVVTPPAGACACGGMVNEPGRSMTVADETALISRDAGRETIVMSLSTRSDATRAGLLIPTPKPAKATLADRQLFRDLEQQTAPRHRVRHHVFGPPLLFGGNDGDGGVNHSGNTAAPGVRVLGSVDLGPLQAVSLTASDAGDLHAWLDKRGFVMSSQFEQLVTPYLENSWAFTAMTLTAEGKSLSGDLPPVSLNFASDRLVYPMRMSRGATDPQLVTTYVLSEHRVRRTDPSAAQGHLDTSYADRIRPAAVSSADLKRLSTGKPWLTQVTQRFTQPKTQVRSDFTFGRAAHDAPVVEYRYDDEYFIPVDVAVILTLLVAGAGVGVVVLVRRRQRARS